MKTTPPDAGPAADGGVSHLSDGEYRANAKEMKGKIDAGKLSEAKMNAAAIALHSTRIAALFPEGSTSDASRAKEEIWQTWEAFLASATALSTEANALTVAAGENNATRSQRTYAKDGSGRVRAVTTSFASRRNKPRGELYCSLAKNVR